MIKELRRQKSPDVFVAPTYYSRKEKTDTKE
jgi:hypothetical protein